MTTTRVLMLVLSIVLVGGGVASAGIINVPEDQLTIQAAIDVAVEGDEIVVAPGIYVETVDLLGKAITLRSTDPENAEIVATTVIDGNGVGTVVTCVGGGPNETVIDGLTVTGGVGSRSGAHAGGLYGQDCVLVVRHCVFTGNVAGGVGGGLYAQSDSATVTDCLLCGNSAAHGGAIYSTSNLTVMHCTFDGNSASSQGGGLHDSGSNSTVTDCNFRENMATSGGGYLAVGGGVSNLLARCTFEGNSASNEGGGVFAGLAALFDDCTFTGNMASQGGGLYWVGNSSAKAIAANCNFSGNVATNEGGGAYLRNATANLSLFTDNWAAFGGAIYAFEDAVIASSTFTTNVAAVIGGAIYAEGSAPNLIPVIGASTFCGNTPTTISGLYVDGGKNVYQTTCGSSLGACCLDSSCIVASDQSCSEAGGVFQDDGSDCGSVECPSPLVGACCVHDTCLQLYEAACLGAGGQWNEAVTCEEASCPAPCPGDVTGDGLVDVRDLTLVILNWGICP